MLNTANTLEQLTKRLDANTYSAKDLNDFIFGIIQPQTTDVALEIGCGSGKQLIPISKMVRKIVGLDISDEMIADLRTTVSDQKNVELVVSGMDGLSGLGLESNFNLIYSAYSIYYSQDIPALVNNVYRLLKGNGDRFFSVAPDVRNNVEWFADLDHLFELPQEILHSGDISRTVVIPAMLDTFGEVHCYTFKNSVTFDSLDDLMEYYDGCRSYCLPQQREKAKDHFKLFFANGGRYVINKAALGVLAYRRN